VAQHVHVLDGCQMYSSARTIYFNKVTHALLYSKFSVVLAAVVPTDTIKGRGSFTLLDQISYIFQHFSLKFLKFQFFYFKIYMCLDNLKPIYLFVALFV